MSQSSTASKHTFRAGAAEVDITPWLGVSLAGHFRDRFAEDIDDPLFAKALVLDDGETRLAMCVLDLIGLPLADAQAIRGRVGKLCEIPPDNVMIACTHTHTGPTVRTAAVARRDEKYVEWLILRVADAIRLAELRLKPARLGSGAGSLSGVSFCRRYHMRDGTVQFNPGRGNPDIVRPTSPIDPSVGILYVEDLDARPMAVLARFSLHYVGTDNPVHVSADYYGHFAVAMRQILGPQCQPMLMNGTSGQINAINPLDPKQLTGHRQARRVASALAAEVCRVITTLTPEEDVPLAATVLPVTLPRKRVTREDVEIAERILAGDDPNPKAGPFSFVVGQPIPENLRLAYARSCGALFKCQDAIQSQVQVFRVGQVGWVALPGEIFVEIGQAIQGNSCAGQTVVVSLANDSLGYIATDHALTKEGGYETWANIGNPVGVGAEGVIRNAALEGLQQLFAK